MNIKVPYGTFMFSANQKENAPSNLAVYGAGHVGRG